MDKLFMIGIGGKKTPANIEVHDVCFIIADKIEDCYECLKTNWYGESLHIDTYKVINGANGYHLTLSDQPTDDQEKLFFVNMGGYDQQVFGELHEVGLFVANSEQEAREQSKDLLLVDTDNQHIDNIYPVEDLLLFTGNKKYLILTKDDVDYQLIPDWNGYNKLR